MDLYGNMIGERYTGRRHGGRQEGLWTFDHPRRYFHDTFLYRVYNVAIGTRNNWKVALNLLEKLIFYSFMKKYNKYEHVHTRI